MNNQENIELDLETLNRQIAFAEAEERESEARLAVNRKLREDLLAEQKRRLNDPKERAKMFANANSMIEAGVKEYDEKGYSCDVARDENGLFTKIIFKKTRSGTRRAGNKSSNNTHPAMTKDQFSSIYNMLSDKFNNADIVAALIKNDGTGKHTSFRTQPCLSNILSKGLENIKIEKVGTKGRGVSYKKIS